MKKFSQFSTLLLRWYHRHKRDMPWRQAHDPYAILVSEIMLQQTTVAAVIPKYIQWMKVFPTVQKLSQARLQTVLAQWQGLGYYNRAKNLYRAAKIIVETYNGNIPEDPDVLKKLPGLGPYTAGAVSSIAFNRAIPIIDANVRRVVMRVLAIQGKSDISVDDKVLDFLNHVLARRSAGNFNQAMMELGALVCGRIPQCLQCPVRAMCAAYQKDLQSSIPQRIKKIIKPVKAAVAVIEHHGKFLLQKRAPGGLLGDLWEFPGGKIEKDETSRQAIIREVREEIGADVKSAQLIFQTHHFYTEYKVFLDVWRCALKEPLKGTSLQKWVSLKSISRFPLPSGSVKIVDHLRRIKKG